ncbi:MAG TPA: hypothetical protein VFZ34_23475, partial [Blastocatellia bacterium]|nr:hypothetical protein [Blastocatellia bacterium]
WISSAACDEKTIPVTIDCDDDTACRDRSDKIYKVIEKAKLASSNTKSVDLTLIGRLKGPNESGYGHLNKSKYLFLIQEIEAVAGLPVQR